MTHDNELRLRLRSAVEQGRARQQHTPSSPSEPPTTDWRIGNFGTSLAPSTIDLYEATYGSLVRADGQPQSAFWTESAVALVESALVAEATELVELEPRLALEQDLHEQRRQEAEAKHVRYLTLKHAQMHAPPPEAPLTRMWGRLMRVQAEEPEASWPSQMAWTEPEDLPRASSAPIARAYWAWKDAEAAVAAGPEHERRVVRAADGQELGSLESALQKRITWLERLAGVRHSRLGLLREHLERHWRAPRAVDDDQVVGFQNDFGETTMVSRRKLLGRDARPQRLN